WNDENATDEVDCPSRICNGTNRQFQCRNKEYISYEVVCNDIRNRTDGGDEPPSCDINEPLSPIYCTNKYYVRAIGPDEKNELTVSRDFMELSGITCD
ncbi:unnamed protein product, partial [Rotaria sp. Silwood1]